MLVEVADGLHGLYEVAVPALQGSDGSLAPSTPVSSFAEAAEGVRRVLLFRDPHRRHDGVLADSPRCVAAITKSLLVDAGLGAMVPTTITEDDGDDDGAGGEARSQSLLSSSEGYMPFRIVQSASQLMVDMPLWFRTIGITQAVAARAAAHVLGAPSRFADTRHGRWHVYVVDGRRPSGAGSRVDATALHGTTGNDVRDVPIVIVHGLFTTSMSVLPLAFLVADTTHRLVLVPGLLDFDFGFSSSFAHAHGGAPGGSAGGGGGLGASISPLSWSDHKQVSMLIMVRQYRLPATVAATPPSVTAPPPPQRRPR